MALLITSQVYRYYDVCNRQNEGWRDSIPVICGPVLPVSRSGLKLGRVFDLAKGGKRRTIAVVTCFSLCPLRFGKVKNHEDVEHCRTRKPPCDRWGVFDRGAAERMSVGRREARQTADSRADEGRRQPAAEAKPKPETQQPPAGTEPAAKPESPEKDLSQELEEVAEKPRDLGQPLVDDPSKLVRLDPKQPVWIDKQNKQVVLLGEVCKAGYPLEFLATYSNRSYEAVMSVNVTPSIVHAGLLAIGAEPGHPARFEPEFVAPTGTEIAIEVRWKDPEGKIQSAPAQHWIRNIKTKKELDSNWVFAGSLFVTDEATGKKYYQADSGELICVLSLPTAMLDLPIRSYGAIEARSFEAFEEHLPARGHADHDPAEADSRGQAGRAGRRQPETRRGGAEGHPVGRAVVGAGGSGAILAKLGNSRRLLQERR